MGGARSSTPVLDSLAKQGYVFTNAVAVASWTLPSAMSVMTGTYPSLHGVINKELFGETEEEGLVPAALSKTSPGLKSLVQVFKSHGYATGGFAGGAALNASYGFDAGFDTYVSNGDFEDIRDSSLRALDFIRSHAQEKWFVYLHGFDVHGQYVPPEGYDRRYVSSSYTGTLTGSAEEQKALREQGVVQESLYMTPEDAAFLRALYDEKVARLDARIGQFLAAYEALALPRKTIIVFSSNHGDEFYEHGRIDHGMTLYDEVLRIPLIFVVPGARQNVRSKAQVRNIDIVPTLMDLVGIRAPLRVANDVYGVSLVPLMNGADLRLDAYPVTSYRYATFQTAIRSWNGWKLVFDQETGVKRLYYTPKDTMERNDRYGTGESIEPELVNKLLQHMNQARQTRASLKGK